MPRGCPENYSGALGIGMGIVFKNDFQNDLFSFWKFVLKWILVLKRNDLWYLKSFWYFLKTKNDRKIFYKNDFCIMNEKLINQRFSFSNEKTIYFHFISKTKNECFLFFVNKQKSIFFVFCFKTKKN